MSIVMEGQNPSPSAELFVPASFDRAKADEIDRPVVGYWREAWRQFRRNRMALAGLIVLVLMGIMAIIGPHLNGFDYRTQDLYNMYAPPSAEHWLGTDVLGRDVFTRLWYGARISLLIGIFSAALDLLIGAVYGGISGYFGGTVDDVMMRIVDILYGIPYLLIVILLMVVMGPGFWTIILAMGLTGWVGMARLVRGQVLQLREYEYALAARALGASHWRILFRHLLPNSLGVILVNVTLTIPGAIFGEAFLSFIGLGIPDPMASLGTMVNSGYQVMQAFPLQLIVPAIALSLIMLGFNFVGDGLRDALDPRLRK